MIPATHGADPRISRADYPAPPTTQIFTPTYCLQPQHPPSGCVVTLEYQAVRIRRQAILVMPLPTFVRPDPFLCHMAGAVRCGYYEGGSFLDRRIIRAVEPVMSFRKERTLCAKCLP